jgi:DNA-binding LacI/PurR family transcriptional regulator
MAMTIGDIASIAGVSRATVSGVLNDSPTVSDKTRKKVLAIIKKHNYRPNEVARALALNHTDTLGLVVKDISNPLYGKISLGVEEIVDEENFSVIIGNTHKDEKREVSLVTMLKRRRVDGLIIFPVQKVENIEHIKDLYNERYPFVLLAEIPGIDADFVRADDETGAYEATKHLLKLGRKKIGYISGPYSALASDRRRRGYEKALFNNGLGPKSHQVFDGGWRVEDGYKAGREFLACANNCPDSVLCYNDSVAIGLIRALVEAGVNVPDDTAVIGFDDAGVGAFLETGLTTVAQPALEIGRRAAKLVMDRIKNIDSFAEPQKVLLNTNLVVRETCGANKKGSVNVWASKPEMMYETVL